MATIKSPKRKPHHEIDPIFLERWSPRAFTGRAIADSVLLRGLEAARWAPSGGNSQPWRFIFSKNGSSTWTKFNQFLVEDNRLWAKNASALLVLLARKDFIWDGQLQTSTSYSLDAGAAWLSFALQMSKLGWATHAMGGFNRERVRTELNVPHNFSVELMIAVGKVGDKSALPESLQSREFMNDRKPLEEIVQEGVFKEEWRSE